MSQNRAYQGPSFGANRGARRPSAVRSNADDNYLDVENDNGFLSNRSNISTAESRTSRRSQQHGLKNESNFSHHSHVTTGTQRQEFHGDHPERVAPLHDPAGKPLRRHGTETIGELLLHPLKELQLHTKRTEAYEVEKTEWNEKHPESIASKKDIDHTEEPMYVVRFFLC